MNCTNLIEIFSSKKEGSLNFFIYLLSFKKLRLSFKITSFYILLLLNFILTKAFRH